MKSATTSELHTQADFFVQKSPELRIDASFSTAKRMALDAHSWIEIVPGWLQGSELLFDRMLAEVHWQEHDRKMFDQVFREPRMTAEYKTLPEVRNEVLLDAVRVLSNRYRVTYDGIWMNLYRHAQDSTSWHGDHRSCRRLENIVPVLTLGATRRFLIKPRRGGRSIVFKPRAGDLVVMGGRSQKEWLHCVPKESGIVAARISVNFQSSIQATREP